MHQVCDVCINKPYKNGVAAEFIDTISIKYNEWQSNRDEEDDGIFRVNLSSGATKPLIFNLCVHFNVDVRRIVVVRIMLAVGFLTPHLLGLTMNPNR